MWFRACRVASAAVSMQGPWVGRVSTNFLSGLKELRKSLQPVGSYCLSAMRSSSCKSLPQAEEDGGDGREAVTGQMQICDDNSLVDSLNSAIQTQCDKVSPQSCAARKCTSDTARDWPKERHSKRSS